MSTQPETLSAIDGARLGVVLPFERPAHEAGEIGKDVEPGSELSSEQQAVNEVIRWLKEQIGRTERCLEEWINIGEVNHIELGKARLKIEVLHRELENLESFALIDDEDFMGAIVSRDAKISDLKSKKPVLAQLKESTELYEGALGQYREIALDHMDKLVGVLELLQAKLAEFMALKVRSDRRQTQLQQLLDSIELHQQYINAFDDETLHPSQTRVQEQFGIHQEHDQTQMELASVALDNPYIAEDLTMRRKTVDNSNKIINDHSKKVTALQVAIRENVERVKAIYAQLKREMEDAMETTINPAIVDSGKWDNLRDGHQTDINKAIPSRTKYGLLAKR